VKTDFIREKSRRCKRAAHYVVTGFTFGVLGI
jgi:hypothetical protein